MTSYHSTPLKYGDKVIDEFIPKDVTDLTVLRVDEYTPDFTDLKTKLYQVLDSPIGSKPFDELVKDVYSEGKRILFMVDDKTRPKK